VNDWSNRAIRTLVDGNAKFQAAMAGEQVWNLNLDQIESHGGRVLEKVYVSKESLGPSTYAFEPRTVLYSKLRPYLNKVVVADEAGYATTELVPLRCKPNEVHPEYLAYFLRSSNFLKFANMVVAGAKMPRMVMTEFWDFLVPIPPLPEQRRIAAILDQADALRAKRREALAQLDSLTQSIFIEMFGDPVTKFCLVQKMR
jgi:type I restriction enzyme S subunit